MLGILQARILEWLAMSSSRDLLDPGIEPVSPIAPALLADSLLSETPKQTILLFLFPSLTDKLKNLYVKNWSWTWLVSVQFLFIPSLSKIYVLKSIDLKHKIKCIFIDTTPK